MSELVASASQALSTLTNNKPVRKWLFATGKAAWILGSSLLVVVVPLVIELDREQQLMEMENQQMGVLSGGAASGAAAPASS